jgi:hypothetical protein
VARSSPARLRCHLTAPATSAPARQEALRCLGLGAWNGGPQIWVVQIFNQQDKGWGCYSRSDVPGGTISVNCGYYR